MPTFSVNTNQSPWRVTFRPRGFSNLLSLRSSAMEDEDIAATDFFFEPTLICTFLDETDFFELVTVVDVWDEDFIDVDIEEEDWEMDFLEVCDDAVVEIWFSNIGGGSLALVVWSAKISFSTSLAGGSETRRTWSTRTWMSQFRPGLTFPAAGWTGLRLEDVSTWQVNFMVLDCRSVERDCRVAVSPPAELAADPHCPHNRHSASAEDEEQLLCQGFLRGCRLGTIPDAAVFFFSDAPFTRLQTGSQHSLNCLPFVPCPQQMNADVLTPPMLTVQFSSGGDRERMERQLFPSCHPLFLFI